MQLMCEWYKRLRRSSKEDNVATRPKESLDHWIAPRIFHYISFALHFICITFHLHYINRNLMDTFKVFRR